MLRIRVFTEQAEAGRSIIQSEMESILLQFSSKEKL